MKSTCVDETTSGRCGSIFATKVLVHGRVEMVSKWQRRTLGLGNGTNLYINKMTELKLLPTAPCHDQRPVLHAHNDVAMNLVASKAAWKKLYNPIATVNMSEESLIVGFLVMWQ